MEGLKKQEPDRRPEQLIPRTASIRRICELYGLGRSKIYKLLAAGEITACKVGRRTLIDTQSVESWLSRQPTYLARGD
jgi:excisionase family DNA binding protein